MQTDTDQYTKHTKKQLKECQSIKYTRTELRLDKKSAVFVYYNSPSRVIQKTEKFYDSKKFRIELLASFVLKINFFSVGQSEANYFQNYRLNNREITES